MHVYIPTFIITFYKLNIISESFPREENLFPVKIIHGKIIYSGYNVSRGKNYSVKSVHVMCPRQENLFPAKYGYGKKISFVHNVPTGRKIIPFVHYVSKEEN